ncbi:MAG: hypothetical protein JNM72_24140 [Deltaproteobacteria bacterium]|nr:hypothetical protein [Deltaproteobacteria bacterium]
MFSCDFRQRATGTASMKVVPEERSIHLGGACSDSVQDTLGPYDVAST